MYGRNMLMREIVRSELVFGEKLQFLMPNIVYFYFKFMVVLEIGDMK